MKRHTGWIVCVIAGCVAMLFVLRAWSWFAEKRAIAQFLATGASVSFESDGRVNDLLGYHNYHSDDERALFMAAQSDEQIVAQRGAPPYGRAWAINVSDDLGVQVVLNNRFAFSGIENASLEDGVSDQAARRFFDAVSRGSFPLDGVTCYAAIDQQETLDALLRLELKNLLIGCPRIDAVDLSALKGNPTLKSLWINEGEYGCEGSQQPSRYDALDFAAIASLPQLELLVVAGLDLSDDMAEEIGRATQLEQLILTRCRLSEAALDQLDARLPDVSIEVRPPAGGT